MNRKASSAAVTAAVLLSLLPALAAAQTPPIKVGINFPPIPTIDPACELQLQLAALGVANPQPSGTFSNTCAGPYHPRYFPAPAMIALADGTALLAGGLDLIPGKDVLVGQNQSEAELYQPSTGIWVSTGAMEVIRVGHSVTLLGNGEVLVVGGITSPGQSDPAQLVEIYNASQHGFRGATNSLLRHSGGHSATLLKNGKVLLAGGAVCAGCAASAAAELYDPVANSWSLAGSMNTARAWHTATLLADGRVLVAGGASNYLYDSTPSLATAELYDPASNSFTPTGSLDAARSIAAAGLLRDGRVLVYSGAACGAPTPYGNTCNDPGVIDVYDPAAGQFLPYGPVLSSTTAQAAAVVVLPSGKALLMNSNHPALLFDPATNGLSAASNQSAACPFAPATLLPDGQVLSQGAIDQCNSLARTTLVYQPLPN